MNSLEGEKAPEFYLEGSDGKSHALSDYRGKKLIIYFYPRDNTPGCTKEACTFRDLHSELTEMKVSLLGVSKDSLASHDKFINKFELPFCLLSDPDTSMMKAYGAFGEKKMYGKVSMGTIRSTFVIDEEGTVLKQWSPVKKAEQHPNEVIEFIKGIK